MGLTHKYVCCYSARPWECRCLRARSGNSTLLTASSGNTPLTWCQESGPARFSNRSPSAVAPGVSRVMSAICQRVVSAAGIGRRACSARFRPGSRHCVPPVMREELVEAVRRRCACATRRRRRGPSRAAAELRDRGRAAAPRGAIPATRIGVRPSSTGTVAGGDHGAGRHSAVTTTGVRSVVPL